MYKIMAIHLQCIMTVANEYKHIIDGFNRQQKLLFLSTMATSITNPAPLLYQEHFRLHQKQHV